MRDFIGLKGDKWLWQRFVRVVKLNNSQVWNVLKPCIEKYIHKSKKGEK